MVGNGDLLACEGMCATVPIKIQQHVFLVDFFILPLQRWFWVFSGCNCWVLLCWTIKSWLSFQRNGERVQLQGEEACSSNPMTLHQLRKLHFRDSVASFFCLQLQLVPDSVELERAPEISKLLAEFEDVLAELNSLSPSRHMDHQIHLTPNAQPVNVRPCRYPYFQKEEIKKIGVRDVKIRNYSA